MTFLHDYERCSSELLRRYGFESKRQLSFRLVDLGRDRNGFLRLRQEAARSDPLVRRRPNDRPLLYHQLGAINVRGVHRTYRLHVHPPSEWVLMRASSSVPRPRGSENIRESKRVILGSPSIHENQSPPTSRPRPTRASRRSGFDGVSPYPGFCCGFGTVRGTWLREVRNDGLTPARLLTYKQNLLEK